MTGRVTSCQNLISAYISRWVELGGKLLLTDFRRRSRVSEQTLTSYDKRDDAGDKPVSFKGSLMKSYLGRAEESSFVLKERCMRWETVFRN